MGPCVRRDDSLKNVTRNKQGSCVDRIENSICDSPAHEGRERRLLVGCVPRFSSAQQRVGWVEPFENPSSSQTAINGYRVAPPIYALIPRYIASGCGVGVPVVHNDESPRGFTLFPSYPRNDP